MTNYDDKAIEKAYENLPKDVQQAMASSDVTKKIFEISRDKGLFIDQADKLSECISYVMLGFIKSSDFIRTISKELGIEEKKAIEITQDINKEIFDKMRSSLQKIEAENPESGMENIDVPAQPQSGEETIMTDTEKATQKSVISAVEEAGGFVIDKPGETGSYEQAIEKPISRQAVLDEIEKDTSLGRFVAASTAVRRPISAPTNKPITDSDHLLGDTPEIAAPAAISPPVPAAQAKPAQAPRQNQASIIDTLLSKGIAMPMDNGNASAPQKPEGKTKPYDGTDPYREPIG